jgi:hypothetical protein
MRMSHPPPADLELARRERFEAQVGVKAGRGQRWEYVGEPIDLGEACMMAHSHVAFEVGLFLLRIDERARSRGRRPMPNSAEIKLRRCPPADDLVVAAREGVSCQVAMRAGPRELFEDIGEPVGLAEACAIAYALVAYEVAVFMRHSDGRRTYYWTSTDPADFNSIILTLKI